jgi:hypothetical protein
VPLVKSGVFGDVAPLQAAINTQQNPLQLLIQVLQHRDVNDQSDIFAQVSIFTMLMHFLDVIFTVNASNPPTLARDHEGFPR